MFALSSDAAFSIPVIIAPLPWGVKASTVRMPDPKQKNIKFQDLKNGEEGQDLVEYALVVALIAFGATAGMGALAGGINKAFNTISTSLSTSI